MLGRFVRRANVSKPRTLAVRTRMGRGFRVPQFERTILHLRSSAFPKVTTRFPCYQQHNSHRLVFNRPTLRFFSSIATSSTMSTNASSEQKKCPTELRFDLEPEQILSLVKETIAISKKMLDDVVALAETATYEYGVTKFEDTPLQLMADEDARFNVLHSNIYFPSQVSPNKAAREASVAANTELSDYEVEKTMREDVYKAVKSYVAKIDAAAKKINPEYTYKDILSKDEAYFTTKVLKEFQRNGFDLPEDKRARLKEVRQEMNKLCIQFQQNLNEDTTSYAFTREELDGMSEKYLSSLKQENGKYIVTLKYPDYFPLMKDCKVEETRKRMATLKEAQCKDQNAELLEKVVRLRQEEAELLGFANHAEFVLDIRMAKTPKAVKDFLERMSKKLEAGLQQDLADLLALKKAEKEALNQPFDNTIHFWDYRYYTNMLLKQKYNIDHDRISEYFPLDVVTKGLLETYQEILSLRFKESDPENTHVWHSDVRQFEVYDKTTNEFIGYFYLDLFPREGKYGHAAEFSLQKGCFTQGKWRPPVAAMVANFPKPTADKPALLRHEDVVTYFHEFGHVMHEVMSKARFAPVAGTCVQLDFVEAPSQMLENWCYEKECLLRISKHYKTGEPLPDEDIERLIKAKNLCIALFLRRQIFFGMFDMTIHTLPKEELANFSLESIWHKLSKEIMGIAPPPNTNGAAGFGHLTGGYSAGYYSYLWADVFSADMFKYFKKNGKSLFDETVGRRYRDLVLAPGGSCDAMELLVNFLGREPTEDALLEHIGLLPPQ